MQAGQPTATTDAGQVAEWLGFFLALGVVIVFLAAFALGRMSVVSVRDARIARQRHAETDDEAEDRSVSRPDDRADRATVAGRARARATPTR